jgi:hypothetical protein
MFLLPDAGREGFFGVVLMDGDYRLQDDGAGIGPEVHEMHRAAGEANTVLKGLLLGVKSRKSRQKSWVDVQDGMGKRFDHHIGQYPHEAGQEYQLNAVVPQDLNQGGIILPTAGVSADLVDDRWNAVLFRTLQGKGVLSVADDAGYAGIDLAGLDTVDDSLQICAVSRDQHSQP